ncbi:hypothetical protein NQZ68_002421 [Scomber scombrus]|uniref:Uncharacterized protein n=1 Tax=Scomber scombrus TaxID=13677 RepID=A0AAV1PZI6_SCOSC
MEASHESPRRGNAKMGGLIIFFIIIIIAEVAERQGRWRRVSIPCCLWVMCAYIFILCLFSACVGSCDQMYDCSHVPGSEVRPASELCASLHHHGNRSSRRRTTPTHPSSRWAELKMLDMQHKKKTVA